MRIILKKGERKKVRDEKEARKKSKEKNASPDVLVKHLLENEAFSTSRSNTNSEFRLSTRRASSLRNTTSAEFTVASVSISTFSLAVFANVDRKNIDETPPSPTAFSGLIALF